jgi:hypothetical protein
MGKRHYGKELAKEIESKGYSIKKVSENIGLSIPTLKARLKDGDFTINQLEALFDNRYINQ